MNNSTSQMFTDGFEMIRNANVKVYEGQDQKKHQIALIEVDDKHQYAFPSTSRVSKALAHTDADNIAARMSGGDFFFHEGELVNFQYGDSKGFVHSDDSIQALINHIGFTKGDVNRIAYNRLNSQDLRLQSVHSAVEIEIPEYKDGGNLSSQLSFAWNPFQSFVSTNFELIRLICSNGMTGLTTFLRNKIPLVNEWKDHLAIANKQIQNTVTGTIQKRMLEMSTIPANVRDCQRVVDYCKNRWTDNMVNLEDQHASKVLFNNAVVADPEFHLENHYTNNVLKDRRLAEQYDAHISLFTLWNMLTEITTHTHACEKATDFAIHKHANEVIFDRGISTNKRSTHGAQLSPTFNNVEAAFIALH